MYLIPVRDSKTFVRMSTRYTKYNFLLNNLCQQF